MEEGFALWANPSSPHAEGRKAKQALEDARDRIKRALGWDGEVIFTSGASEALAIALRQSKAEHFAASTAEHDAVFANGNGTFHAALKVGQNGRIGRGELYEAMGVVGTSPDDERSPSLTFIQHVNSETGAILNVDAMVKIAGNFPEAKILSDCSQSAGKLPLPSAQMVVLSAHKLGGPIGIGALLVRDYGMLEPMGGHERGYRRGTENVPAALGFAAAIEAGAWQTTRQQRAQFLDQFGEARLSFPNQVDYIGALTHPALSAQALLIRLDAKGFAVSAGSACSSGTLKKSRVLDAFGVSDDVAARTIRVSLGWNTTQEELEQFTEAWKSLI